MWFGEQITNGTKCGLALIPITTETTDKINRMWRNVTEEFVSKTRQIFTRL